MIRVPRRRGGPATVTEKVHEPVRLNESVATHSACVTPTGKLVPEGGVQATDTVPWPFRLSGSAYVTAAPTLVRAETVTGAGQVTSGASATGAAAPGSARSACCCIPRSKSARAASGKPLIVPPPWFFSSLVRVNASPHILNTLESDTTVSRFSPTHSIEAMQWTLRSRGELARRGRARLFDL